MRRRRDLHQHHDAQRFGARARLQQVQPRQQLHTPEQPGYGTSYNLDREWVRTALPSGRAIDGAYDNGGQLHDVTYPKGAVALSYFYNTDWVGTIARSAAPVPDTSTQTISFSYEGFLTTSGTRFPAFPLDIETSSTIYS